MKALFMIVLFFALGLLITPNGSAAIFKYIDKDGMINFADDLQSVPAQYRASAKIVSGEAKEGDEKRLPEQNPLPARTGAKPGEAAPAVAQTQPIAEIGENSSFGRRVLLSAIVVVSALFAFIILGIIDADHKKSIAITRVVIVWGVSVYLLYAHAGDVATAFSSMGKTFDNVQRRSEEKGKKAAKAVKTLNAVIEQAEKSSPNEPAGAEPEKKE